MITRISLDPIFYQKDGERLRGNRRKIGRSVSRYSASCIDMRADDALISAEERFQRCDARAQQRDLGLLGACAVGAQ